MIGVRFIEDWKSEFRDRNRRKERQSGKILDNEIVRSFISLEIQMIPFYDRRPWEVHKCLRCEYEEYVGETPKVFTEVIGAQGYLQVIMKHLTHFLRFVDGPLGFIMKRRKRPLSQTKKVTPPQKLSFIKKSIKQNSANGIRHSNLFSTDLPQKRNSILPVCFLTCNYTTRPLISSSKLRFLKTPSFTTLSLKNSHSWSQSQGR